MSEHTTHRQTLEQTVHAAEQQTVESSVVSSQRAAVEQAHVAAHRQAHMPTDSRAICIAHFSAFVAAFGPAL